VLLNEVAVPERVTITRPEVARALIDLRTAQRLEPFMKRELTLSEAAHELKVKLPALLYHVERFLGFGLLSVTRIKTRAGRPLKLYRSTAQSFFVPYHLTPSETLAQLLGDLMAPTERRFHREAARTLQSLDPDWGLHISCHTDEGMSYALAPRGTNFVPRLLESVLKPDAPALFLSDGTLELDFETAKELQRALIDLFESYRQKQQPGRQRYAYRFGLTPVHDEHFDP
jgi:hypothetical protein